MTQVLQHDYGKSKVSLLQIRSAIKAVRAEQSVAGSAPVKRRRTTGHKAAPGAAGRLKRK